MKEVQVILTLPDDVKLEDIEKAVRSGFTSHDLPLVHMGTRALGYGSDR